MLVGDERELDQVERHRTAMADLADPRRCHAAAMERLVAATRPFYMLHGGLHSTETGSPEMLMELVYRLAVSEAPLVREVRDNLIVLVNPVAEPDGRDREVDWFYRHLKGKTDFDALPPRSAPYWGKYVFHDNNRDGIQRRLALTRATQDAFLRWHPVVVHDLHESIPLLSIWTGHGPYNVNLDPITASEWHAIAFNEVATLTAMGMPGVWTWGFGEGWAHVYADSVAINHNAIGRGYETFGNATAEKSCSDRRQGRSWQGSSTLPLVIDHEPSSIYVSLGYKDSGIPVGKIRTQLEIRRRVLRTTLIATGPALDRATYASCCG